jgi:hypothetical protein
MIHTLDDFVKVKRARTQGFRSKDIREMVCNAKESTFTKKQL